MSSNYSVIIATRNYGRYIAEAIDSVLAQTIPARNVIVVDDDSQDDTAEVLARYAGRIRVIRQPHSGQGAAWNNAFPFADTEWIAFLDADDYWRPERMERCLAVAAEGDAGVIMHDLEITGGEVGHSGWVAWKEVRPGEGNVGALTVPRGVPWLFVPTSGFVVRRDVLMRILPLDEPRWRVCADAPVLHLSALHTPFRYVDEQLGYYRIHPHNSYQAPDRRRGGLDPRLVLDNLWLLQRIAYEVNRELERLGRTDRVALWNHDYYARTVGWVAGRGALQHSRDLWRLRPRAGIEPRRALHELKHIREHMRNRKVLGSTVRELVAERYDALDLVNLWEPALP